MAQLSATRMAVAAAGAEAGTTSLTFRLVATMIDGSTRLEMGLPTTGNDGTVHATATMTTQTCMKRKEVAMAAEKSSKCRSMSNKSCSNTNCSGACNDNDVTAAPTWTPPTALQTYPGRMPEAAPTSANSKEHGTMRLANAPRWTVVADLLAKRSERTGSAQPTVPGHTRVRRAARSEDRALARTDGLCWPSGGRLWGGGYEVPRNLRKRCRRRVFGRPGPTLAQIGHNGFGQACDWRETRSARP